MGDQGPWRNHTITLLAQGKKPWEIICKLYHVVCCDNLSLPLPRVLMGPLSSITHPPTGPPDPGASQPLLTWLLLPLLLLLLLLAAYFFR